LRRIGRKVRVCIIVKFSEIIQEEMEEEIRKNRDEETIQTAPIKEVKKRE
jgi:hypothetical protein